MNSRPLASALAASPPVAANGLGTRGLALRVGGRRHGPIARLVSPGDLGEALKPFVFLDHGQLDSEHRAFFGLHPHSGIATLTTVLTGTLTSEDTSGRSGLIVAGGVEWMNAGGGVWHGGEVLPGVPARFFQLWVALPPDQERGPPFSQFVAPGEIQKEGPARVLLGRHGRAKSVIPAPAGINYLHVELADGERWTYQPPADHDVAFLCVDEGVALVPDPIRSGELAVFEQARGAAITIEARDRTALVLGSAVKHRYPLVSGYYSVHTSVDALDRGEAEIERIGLRLREEGRLP